MKNYSKITENKDILTKEYADSTYAKVNSVDKCVKLSTTNATVGATDKPIYVQNGTAMVATDVMKEAFLQWGGKNFAGNYGPLDAALISDLGADRFAFIPAAKWQVEYSRDNGRTWQDYGATDAQKLSLTSVGTSLSIGKATSENKATADYKLRLTLTTTNAVYSVLNKFAIDVSTSGSTGCYVTIEGRTKANVDAGANTWVTFAENIPVSGWSGWNIINTSGITTHGNTNNQYANLRFTFGCTGGSSTYPGLQIRRLKAFGGVGWQTPSNMAQYGSLYRYDYSQNALFPADVYIQNNIKVASINDVNKKQDIISDTNKLSASLVSGLATVATSGSYDDLSHKPDIPDPNNLAKLNTENTFTAKQTINSGYGAVSLKTQGYVEIGASFASKSDIGGLFGYKDDGTGRIYAVVPRDLGFVESIKMNNSSIEPDNTGTVDLGTVITDVSEKANLSGGNIFSGLQTVNAPTNSAGTEQATVKFKTANGGSITFGKEGPDSGSMIRLDQTDGTCRLRFRSSSTAGAMVWEQPEKGAKLFVDLGKSGADYHRIEFPSTDGTLALTYQIPTSSTVSGWGFTKNAGTVTSVAVKMNGETKGTVTSSGTIDLGTVLTDASKFATSAQGTKADTALQSETDPTVPSWAKTPSKPKYTASEVGALSLDGGTINKSKTVKMDASANSDGANLKWGTVNSKNPYIGYASDQVDGTFVVGSLLGTNYASGLAIGGGSGNLLWKGAKVATTSDIPNISGKLDKSAFSLSGTTLTITI